MGRQLQINPIVGSVATANAASSTRDTCGVSSITLTIGANVSVVGEPDAVPEAVSWRDSYGRGIGTPGALTANLEMEAGARLRMYSSFDDSSQARLDISVVRLTAQSLTINVNSSRYHNNAVRETTVHGEFTVPVEVAASSSSSNGGSGMNLWAGAGVSVFNENNAAPSFASGALTQNLLALTACKGYTITLKGRISAGALISMDDAYVESPLLSLRAVGSTSRWSNALSLSLCMTNEAQCMSKSFSPSNGDDHIALVLTEESSGAVPMRLYVNGQEISSSHSKTPFLRNVWCIPRTQRGWNSRVDYDDCTTTPSGSGIDDLISTLRVGGMARDGEQGPSGTLSHALLQLSTDQVADQRG